MPLPLYTAAVAVRAAHAKCLQSGKFLIGAEIASGIDVMNGISRQPMGKFDMPPSPRPLHHVRLVLKYREVESADENHCRNYGTLKISIKKWLRKRDRKAREGKSKWKWKWKMLRDEAIYLIFRTISTFAVGRGKRTLGRPSGKELVRGRRDGEADKNIG